MRIRILLLALLLSGCEGGNKIEFKKYTVITLDGSRYTNLSKTFFLEYDVFINEEGKTIIFNGHYTVIEE